jgi:hypothetical protein
MLVLAGLERFSQLTVFVSFGHGYWLLRQHGFYLGVSNYMKYFTLTLLFFLVIGCSRKQEREIPSTDFLIGEWFVDYDNNDFKVKPSWIYITDNSRFWKFTDWNKRYLLDSSLRVYNGLVIKDRKSVYRLDLVDSTRFKLTDSLNNEIVYKRWRENINIKTEISDYLLRDSLKQMINGFWTVDSVGIGEFPYYDNTGIKKNDLINFSDEGQYIRMKGSDTLQTYSYRVFDTSIWFVDGDAITDNNLILLSSDSLIFRDVNLSRYTYYLKKKE